MSRKKKVVIIIHLCFAFTFLIWLFAQPTLRNILSKKAENSLFESVFEHKEEFEKLSEQEQTFLLNSYGKTKPKTHQENIFKSTSPPVLLWLALSILIPLLLLFHIEGGKQAAWLLPLLVLVSGYFLYAFPKNTKQFSLFPTEEYVLSHYADNSKPALTEKREQLLKGWHRYLITEWGKETPSKEDPAFRKQLDRSLFAFNVARLYHIIEGKEDDLILAGFATPPSLLRLSFYFLWNLFFAWLMNRQERSLKSALQSPLS